MNPMRLISMYKRTGEARLEFYGCPLACKFCNHRLQERRDLPLDQVVRYLSEYDVKNVFVGGADPVQQKRELYELLKVLKMRGKEITLKTTGNDPEFLASVRGIVAKFVIEGKVDLDNVEGTARLVNLPSDKVAEYLGNLRRTLEVLRNEKATLLIRVIPPIVNMTSLEKLGSQVQGLIEDVLLQQFMSSTSDIPFEGISRPSPSIDEMMALGNMLLRYVPRVRVTGDGIDTLLVR